MCSFFFSVVPPPKFKIVLEHAHGVVVQWDVPDSVRAKLMRFKLDVLCTDGAYGRESLVLRVNRVNSRTRAFNLSPLKAGHSYMAILRAVTADVTRPMPPAVLEFAV